VTLGRGQVIWTLLKDVILTGTGVTLILSQMFAKVPSDALLVTGLALTAPTLLDHTKSLLTGPSGESRTGGESLPSASSPSAGLPQDSSS